ncbi:putative tetratricopeptide-like helical domain superfamily [Helianthus annuus]|nr:putative tetratricopeptide-like helical domain superfamily [Helianthus annuus]
MWVRQIREKRVQRHAIQEHCFLECAIGCYGKHGLVDSAIELLDKMEDENMQPNQVTLTCVLASYSHGGLVNKGLTLFKSMRGSQRVEIRHEHYACVIDILCRSG